MVEERFDEGEIVCSRGDPADRVFLVADGHLEITPSDENEHRVLIGPGALFGEYGLFETRSRNATVTATEPTVLLTLDYVRFEAFLIQFPEAMYAILGAAIQQLLEFQTKLSRAA